MEEFEKRELLILDSIVNERCSVAISTEVKVQLIDIHERKKKKLVKLQEKLKLLIEKTSTEKYKKKTKQHWKEKDISEVCITEYL